MICKANKMKAIAEVGEGQLVPESRRTLTQTQEHES